jgi:hypothetical protein
VRDWLRCGGGGGGGDAGVDVESKVGFRGGKDGIGDGRVASFGGEKLISGLSDGSERLR